MNEPVTLADFERLMENPDPWDAIVLIGMPEAMARRVWESVRHAAVVIVCTADQHKMMIEWAGKEAGQQ